jgi:transposase
VTEYQAQRLVNEKGQCFIAPFPDEVTKAVQYGNGIKAHIVYLSQYQLPGKGAMKHCPFSLTSRCA